LQRKLAWGVERGLNGGEKGLPWNRRTHVRYEPNSQRSAGKLSNDNTVLQTLSILNPTPLYVVQLLMKAVFFRVFQEKRNGSGGQEFGKRGLLDFQDFLFLISGSAFVPACDRASTNMLFQFLYHCGHVMVQKQNPKSKKKS
jgi:hypothetical protein